MQLLSPFRRPAGRQPSESPSRKSLRSCTLSEPSVGAVLPTQFDFTGSSLHCTASVCSASWPGRTDLSTAIWPGLAGEIAVSVVLLKFPGGRWACGCLRHCLSTDHVVAYSVGSGSGTHFRWIIEFHGHSRTWRTSLHFSPAPYHA